MNFEKIKKMNSNREKSLVWWGSLSIEQRKQYYLKYKPYTTSLISELKPAEIQKIWAVETEDVTPYIEPIEEVSSDNIESPLELLVKILNKAGVRHNLCVTEFGYSQIERDIVDGLIGWQKEQTKALQESHDKLLEALNVAYKSLCTYGNHPIIEKQVESAIEKAKNYAKK
jgi:hypothetical protein